MRILRPDVHLPRTPIERRLQPLKHGGRYGYRRYRNELRWDFGFTCAICRLHEADFMSGTGHGASFMSIEHYQPMALAPHRANEYANLLYVCRFCNVSRGIKPIESGLGARLLNPTAVAWAEHFAASADKLAFEPCDEDAEYTLEIYDINDPRKITLRRERRDKILECLDIINRGQGTISELLARAEVLVEPTLVEAARMLQQAVVMARRDIERYQAVPPDAPEAGGPKVLSRELTEGSFELDHEH